MLKEKEESQRHQEGGEDGHQTGGKTGENEEIDREKDMKINGKEIEEIINREGNG
jgi:hypothetical protein